MAGWYFTQPYSCPHLSSVFGYYFMTGDAAVKISGKSWLYIYLIILKDVPIQKYDKKNNQSK